MSLTKIKGSVIDLDNAQTATQSTRGMMSKEDKSKLDGIETGATADQIATEILADIITVDGSGSNLDGDLLDGQQGSFYQNADNLNNGTLPSARFNDASHGNRSGGSLHDIATQTTHGFMSSTDKSKLDGIETGAKDDQTPSEILTAIKTVDGSGSGLDADKLDGQEGSFYQNASNLNSGTIPSARFNDISHGNRTGGLLHALATPSVAGFMSPTDKSKLDNLTVGTFALHAEIFSSQTWVVPIGIDRVYVQIWGGGGSGGWPDQYYYAGGGGGGYYIDFAPVDVTPGESIYITIGAGGAAPWAVNANGNTGGTSTFPKYNIFGGWVAAAGGQFGAADIYGGSGGTANGGGQVAAGGNFRTYIGGQSDSNAGGGGGAGYNGNGGDGRRACYPYGTCEPVRGWAYVAQPNSGAGGGGGAYYSQGLAGGSGGCRIYW